MVPTVDFTVDCEESWAPKNWCFWTVVLQKTLESPLDIKEIKPVNPKGNQPWTFTERTDAEAETPVLCHLMRRADSFEKPLMLGKIEAGGEGENRGWEDWMHHWLDGHQFEQTQGYSEAQRNLAYCNLWDHKELDMTERLNWTDWTIQSMEFSRPEYWSE